jgi:dipeptidyl aminopeptidase/acylaminoacyl peptidase
MHHLSPRLRHGILILLCLAPAYQSAESRAQDRRPRVYKSSVTPNWFAENTHFWYRNELAGGRFEYILVDAVKGIRKPAFDHDRLAKALLDAGLKEELVEKMPLDRLRFDLKEKSFAFRAAGKLWRCSPENYELTKLTEKEFVGTARASGKTASYVPRRSAQNGPETYITFLNSTKGTVEVHWVDLSGKRRSYGKIEPGKSREQHTFALHVWEVTDKKGELLTAFVGAETHTRAEITGKVKVNREPPNQRRPQRGPRGPRDRSPDGKWRAFIKGGNVFVAPLGEKTKDEPEKQLSTDGTDEEPYGMLDWADDSNSLVAFQITPGESKEVYLIESSPKEGGRAKLRTRGYPLPGDRFTSYELNLFDVAAGKQTKPKIEVVDFGRPRLRWNRDGKRFTYEKIDRGHQRFRVIEVEVASGKMRNIIDESTDTFIWTAHGPGLRITTYLDETDEMIYASEKDGWRHLYLVDTDKGEVKNRITTGEWVMRGVERVDTEKRQVWFKASGLDADQDPYLIHFCRADFDGSNFVRLTEGNGNHTIRFSPDEKYLIDSYSRVDAAPVTELRRVSDGKLMCELEQADVSELLDSGWHYPEVFSAKGRDGKTDIWGFICRPRDFDLKKKYAIIEDIYAGPHNSFVPKSFSPAERYREYTSLGFIVVKIDGMGTANRSKAFHDVCWHNLKDAGFPDRITWMKAAAKKHPEMDITRVGIYGTSAGGQSSTGALLFHPDFYKVAVSACGCHDNRMDKASWNEQWMGYPVGPHYAESSNIDNAHRLRGKLLLIVGELDTNVPPESTHRLADALIKAGKDFDYLLMPNVGHSSGGSYGQRRREDFFVRHLQGKQPPNRNE